MIPSRTYKASHCPHATVAGNTTLAVNSPIVETAHDLACTFGQSAFMITQKTLATSGISRTTAPPRPIQSR